MNAADTQSPFLRRNYQTLITGSLLLADVAAIVAAFYAGYRLRRLIPIPEIADPNMRFTALLPLLALQLFAIMVAFFIGRMYHRQRTRFGYDEVATIVSGVSIGTLISIAVASFTLKTTSGAYDYSRGTVIYAWLITILLVLLFRAAQSRAQRALQARGYGRTRVVVVGEGDAALAVLQRISSSPRLGYDIVGTIQFDNARTWSDAPQLGTVDDLSRVIEREQVDEVIIAAPEATSQEMIRVISKCDRSTISIKVYPDVFQIMAGQMTMGELGGLPLLNVRDVALRGWKLTLKRGLDVTLSLIGFVLISPFLLALALIIKLDSRGPAFYAQERMGLDGEPFWCIKFRSMRTDAEKGGPGWTVKDDPRVTRLGKFIRRTNLDELPQLVNVLKGEMSLVGPRPERPVYVEEFRKQIPRYMERHREKSGITGWAQVNGLRGDTSIEERTKYDLWYIENWSLWLDIRIIWRTIWNTLSRNDDNAY